MRTLTTAITLGMPHKGKLTLAHIWKATRHNHPEYIKLVKTVDNEDHRVNWLKSKNITDWNKCIKKFIIDIGMGLDKPGLIHKCVCLYFFSIITNYTVLFIFSGPS
jgi:hypothetical protein